MSDFKTHYDVLEVEETATSKEIKTAYHRSCLYYHPDRVPDEFKQDAEEHTKQVTDAYAILGDPGKRRLYDEQLKELRRRAAGAPGGAHSPPPRQASPAPPAAPRQRTRSTSPQPRSPPPPAAPSSVAPSRSVWGVCAVMLIIAAIGYGGWSKSKIPSPAPAATPSSAVPTSVSFGGKTLEVKLEPNQVYDVDDVRAGQSWRYLSFNGAFSHRVDKGDGQACWKLVENNLPWSADWTGKLQVKAGDSAVKFTVNIR
jgi:curved DNA-binding protein CbpA